VATGTYHIRIQTSDGHGGTFEKQFTITASPNSVPTDIGLSNAAVDENQPSGTTVGTLSTTDPDAGDTHTYSLVSGTGSTDNGQFTIDGSGNLKTAASFDFETKSSYSIRVKTDDGNGGTFEKVFTISVTDVNEAPTDLGLSPSSVAENSPLGTTVGNLSSTDPESGDTHTYSLVSGTGSTDNASFTINGSTLQTAAPLPYTTRFRPSIRVHTDDGHGGTFDKVFTITVNDKNDAPTDIALSNSSVAENQASGTTVGTFSST